MQSFFRQVRLWRIGHGTAEIHRWRMARPARSRRLNAGIRQQGPFEEHPVDVWRRTIDVNLTGAFLCSRAASRVMLAAGGGKIVNLAAIAGRLVLRRCAAHNASKAGIMGLTRSIAVELGARDVHCDAVAPGLIETPLSAPYFRDPTMRDIIVTNTPLGRWGRASSLAQHGGPEGIRVNCIHPGFLETPMSAGVGEDARRSAIDHPPLRRLGTAGEGGAMAVVLASDLASFVHGVELDVNGGMYMA